MTKRGTALLVGTVGLGVFGFWSYGQIKKILQASVKFSRIQTKDLTFKHVSFDLFVSLTNPSQIPLTVVSQSYVAYINKTPVARGLSTINQKIRSQDTSMLGMFISLKPNKLGTALLTEYISGKIITVRIVVNVKIKIAFFTFKIPYVYQSTLKELLLKK